MGRYVLDVNKAAQLRPVYKKTDRDYYIYFSSKLCSVEGDYIKFHKLLFSNQTDEKFVNFIQNLMSILVLTINHCRIWKVDDS